jgi:hypothetical protein
MMNNTYLEMWERIRNRIEVILIEQADREELDLISKLLERVQKSELPLRESSEGGLLIVNVHIPGVCTQDP